VASLTFPMALAGGSSSSISDGYLGQKTLPALLALSGLVAGNTVTLTGVTSAPPAGIELIHTGSKWYLRQPTRFSLGNVQGLVQAAEQKLTSILIPAPLLAACGEVEVESGWWKVGVTNTLSSANVRLGSANSAADASVFTLASSTINAANQYRAILTRHRWASDTGLATKGSADLTGSHTGQLSLVVPLDTVAVPDRTTTDMYIGWYCSMGVFSDGTGYPGLKGASITLVP